MAHASHFAGPLAGRPSSVWGRARRWFAPVKLVMLVMAFALALPWFNIPRDQADSAGMLAYLHGLFVQGDLLFDDDYAALGMSPLFAFVTSEGVVSNHWSSGAAWLQAPGYWLGLHGGQWLTERGFGAAAGHPFGVAALLGVRTSSMLLLLACIAGIVRVCRPSVGGVAASALAVVCVFGTPWIYYASEAPLRPHAYGAATVLLFIAMWRQPTLGTPWMRGAVLGALVGVAAAIRPQLAPLVLLAWEDAFFGSARTRRERWQHLAASTAAVVLMAALHGRVQLWMFGLGSQGLGGVTHHLRAFLWSAHHGVFVWCPIFALGLWALFRSSLRRERGAWIIAVLVLWQLWIDAGTKNIEPFSVLGTRTWAGGVAFGPRKLVDIVPLFLPAALSWIEALRQRRRGRWLALASVVAIAPTAVLHVAAILHPIDTTQAVHDFASLGHLMGSVFTSPWGPALGVRALPWSVSMVVGMMVLVPVGAAAWVAMRLRARTDPMRFAFGGVLAFAVVAHVWLAIVLERSERALAADPARMARARATMTPVHLATVSVIPRADAILRARVGEHAAPPLGPASTPSGAALKR